MMEKSELRSTSEKEGSPHYTQSYRKIVLFIRGQNVVKHSELRAGGLLKACVIPYLQPVGLDFAGSP